MKEIKKEKWEIMEKNQRERVNGRRNRNRKENEISKEEYEI